MAGTSPCMAVDAALPKMKGSVSTRSLQNPKSTSKPKPSSSKLSNVFRFLTGKSHQRGGDAATNEDQRSEREQYIDLKRQIRQELSSLDQKSEKMKEDFNRMDEKFTMMKRQISEHKESLLKSGCDDALDNELQQDFQLRIMN